MAFLFSLLKRKGFVIIRENVQKATKNSNEYIPPVQILNCLSTCQVPRPLHYHCMFDYHYLETTLTVSTLIKYPMKLIIVCFNNTFNES